jgi:hypothetical protein
LCTAVEHYNTTDISDSDFNDLMIVLSKCKTLWALSLQKSGQISKLTWQRFLENIPTTNLTHFFADDKSVGASMKKKIVSELRTNRDKCAAERGEAYFAKRHAEGTWYLSII